MDLAAKYHLIEKIVQIQDDNLIKEIQAMLDSREVNYQIPESHQQLLDQRSEEDKEQTQSGEDWRTVLNRIHKEL